MWGRTSCTVWWGADERFIRLLYHTYEKINRYIQNGENSWQQGENLLGLKKKKWMRSAQDTVWNGAEAAKITARCIQCNRETSRQKEGWLTILWREYERRISEILDGYHLRGHNQLVKGQRRSRCTMGVRLVFFFCRVENRIMRQRSGIWMPVRR